MNTEQISKVTDSLLDEESIVSTFQPDDESPFPIDALPSPLREMAESVSDAYDAPIDLAAPQTLSAVSCCLGKGVSLTTNHPDPTYGLLYMFLATRPGVAKSNVSKCLIKPLKEHQIWMRKSYKEATEKRLIQENEEGGKVRKVTKEDIEREIDKSLPTIIVEHYTQEGLANTLSHNDEYLAMVSTDVSGVIDALRGSKAHGCFQGEILLKGYSGESYDCNNKNAKDEHLEEIRLSINWLGTIDTLKVFASDHQINNRGLLSRFCFAEIDKPVPFARVGRKVLDRAIQETWSRFLTDLLVKYWRNNSEPIEGVIASDEAIELGVDFRNEFVTQQDLFGDLSSLGDRWTENAWRIGLILHVSKHPHDPSRHELSQETIYSAIRIMRWFIGRELACVEEFKGHDPSVMECKGRVFNHLKDNGASTIRELHRSAGLKKAQYRLMYNWVRYGELVMWNASKGNKPSPTFALVGDDRIPTNIELITDP